MTTANIHEAKSQLSKLVAPSAPRRLGFMAGEIVVPEDFDRMGEVEIAALFATGPGPIRKI